MWYCSFSESENENKMPLSKFVLFIKDSGALLDSNESVEKSKCIFHNFMNDKVPGVMNKLSISAVELIFSKVIGSLNDNRMELPKEGCPSPMRNEKIVKLYSETENYKRAKMDFKAFYYAVTKVAEKAYPDLTPNRALIEFTNNVFL